MTRLALLLALIVSIPTAQALDFVGNCDSGAASRDKCLEWVQKSLKSLGCSTNPTTSEQACKIHPWGSDFIKSWMCSVSSSNCEPMEHGATSCASGKEYVFKNQWDACKKSAPKSSYEGVCRHEMESHTSVVPSCPDSLSICGKLGGDRASLSVACQKKSISEPIEIQGEPYACEDIAKRCESAGGTLLNEWKVTCKFRQLRIRRTASSCDELRDRCERGNSPKGAKGTLESCVGL